MAVAVSTEFDARLETKAFMDRSRAPYLQWYVGVAADPNERLSEHGVQENDWYIVRRLASADAAQRVAEGLLRAGCDGGSGGGDEESTAVYAYWKRGHTTP